eukprot:4946529-Pyramimonas_sp.AAC.1
MRASAPAMPAAPAILVHMGRPPATRMPRPPWVPEEPISSFPARRPLPSLVNLIVPVYTLLLRVLLVIALILIVFRGSPLVTPASSSTTLSSSSSPSSSSSSYA